MCSLYSFYCAKLGIMRLHGYALNRALISVIWAVTWTFGEPVYNKFEGIFYPVVMLSVAALLGNVATIIAGKFSHWGIPQWRMGILACGAMSLTNLSILMYVISSFDVLKNLSGLDTSSILSSDSTIDPIINMLIWVYMVLDISSYAINVIVYQTYRSKVNNFMSVMYPGKVGDINLSIESLSSSMSMITLAVSAGVGYLLGLGVMVIFVFVLRAAAIVGELYLLNQFQKEYNNPVYQDKLQELAS